MNREKTASAVALPLPAEAERVSTHDRGLASLHAQARDRLGPTLSLTGITKRWPALEHPVLDDVDLVVEPGSAVHVAGRNGVGKTTMLRVISGLIRPDAGTVALDELDPERDRRAFQRQIAVLPAGDRGLYARMSVRRHFQLWVRVGFVPRSRRDEKIEWALDHFGLRELATRRVDRLSMGQRQRVRLAGLVLHDPNLILLDEPLNSLDDEAIALMTETLLELKHAGGSLVWCSPTGDRLDFDFDHAYTLERGKLVA